jgi:hypothetical protein
VRLAGEKPTQEWEPVLQQQPMAKVSFVWVPFGEQWANHRIMSHSSPSRRISTEKTPMGSAISQNGQSSEGRCRAGRFRVFGGFCAALGSGFPSRNRCGTAKTKLFSADKTFG